MQPDFTVVISTYNAAATLPACLESLWAQEDAQFEVLVADGASTDGTVEILSAVQDRLAAFVSEPDRGVYDAWNKVVGKAQGEWVLFLGADDVLANSRVLADALRLLSAAPPQAMYGYGRVTLQAGDEVIERFGDAPFPPGAGRIRHMRPFSHTALFHRRALFERFGEFDASYRISGDAEFLTRSLKYPDVEVVQLDLDVAVMGHGGLSSSVESRLVAYLEDMRALRTHGHPVPPLHTLLLASRAFSAVAIRRIFGKNAAVGVANLYRRLRGRARRNEV